MIYSCEKTIHKKWETPHISLDKDDKGKDRFNTVAPRFGEEVSIHDGARYWRAWVLGKVADSEDKYLISFGRKSKRPRMEVTEQMLHAPNLA